MSTQRKLRRLHKEDRSIGEIEREGESVYWRQEDGVIRNYDPVTMELVRKESLESLMEESRISQLSYIGGKKAKSTAPSQRQTPEFKKAAGRILKPQL